jgi:F-type H+-transporting ATPase subunit c
MFRRFTFSFLVALLFMAVASVAMAAEGTPAAGGDSNVKAVIALAAGFGIAIAAFGGAMGQGKAIAAGLEGIARNPSAQNKIFIPMIVGLALIESLVIYALVIAFVLVGKLSAGGRRKRIRGKGSSGSPFRFPRIRCPLSRFI